MSALQLSQPKAPTLINRPCVRCELTLTDPASVEAGIGPICRGKANEILAKEVPSAWNDTDLFQFMTLTADCFPSADAERFNAVFNKICKSRGMNQGEGQAVKGDDMRDVARELVYLASVATTNAIYETIIGAIKGIGYVQYAAFVKGDSASGEATVTIEGDHVFLSAVRNTVGQNALANIGAQQREKRWFVHQSKALDFLPIVSIYWPFAKGIDEVLNAIESAPKTAPAAPVDLFKQREELVHAMCTETDPDALFALEAFDQAHPEIKRALFASVMTAEQAIQAAPRTTPAAAPAVIPVVVSATPAPVVKSGELAIDHGKHLTHHRIIKETEKAFQIESDDPHARKVNSWVPKSWLKGTSIDGVYRVSSWALDKLTKWQEAALGLRAL